MCHALDILTELACLEPGSACTPGLLQVLRLESRVLELEQQREQDALAKAESGMPVQELVRMAWSQGHSGHRQHQVNKSP